MKCQERSLQLAVPVVKDQRSQAQVPNHFCAYWYNYNNNNIIIYIFLSNQENASAALDCAVMQLEEDLLNATDSFAESNLIGTGGFGKVYKGYLRATYVDIKLITTVKTVSKSKYKTIISCMCCFLLI